MLFLVPGALDRATGGFGYLRRTIGELRAIGWAVDVSELTGPYPCPHARDLEHASDALAACPDGALVVVDGLAFGALPDLARAHADRLTLVAVVHHPLAHETGLDLETAEMLHASERAALQYCRAVVTTGTRTAALLSEEFGVAPGILSVVMPGTERFGRAPRRGNAPVLLCLGAVIPRKGHDVLIRALGRILDLPWECRIVGEVRGDWAQEIMQRAARLQARVTFAGKVESPAAELLNADLFVLPSRYEGYGMAYAEALACGLPIIGCPVGVLPDILPPDAGIMVPVDDVEALAHAARTMIGDSGLRATMSDAAFDAGRRLPDWSESGRLFSSALERAGAA